MNHSIVYLQTTNQHLSDYDFQCVELMGDVLDHVNKTDNMATTQTLYINAISMPNIGLRPRHKRSYCWRYHCVPVINGLVHDAWFPKLILPPKEYVAKAFPNQSLYLEWIEKDGVTAVE